MKKYFDRLIAFAVSLALLMQMLPLQAVAETISVEPITETTMQTEQEAIPVTIVGEMEDLREENSKHFRLSDGSYIAVSYGMPVHYQDEDGSWQDIDNSMTLVAGNGTSAYRLGNSATTTAFASNLSGGQLLVSSFGNVAVSMGLLDPSQVSQHVSASGTATLVTLGGGAVYDRNATAEVVADTESLLQLPENSGWRPEEVIPENLQSSILYEDVYPGVDLQYTAFSYNIKEQIIVKQPQSSYTYHFLLELDGLAYVLNADGSVSLNDATGKLAYSIPAPYMEDAAGVTSHDVSYTITPTDGGMILSVEADADWINARERVFPVNIDPTLSAQASMHGDDIYATYVIEGDPATVHGNPQWLYSGYSCVPINGVLAAEQRIFMHFANLPSVPAEAIITDASLQMYVLGYSHVGCPELGTALYEVTDSLPTDRSSYYNWIHYMNWNNQPEYDDENMIDYAVLKYSAQDKYYGWDMTELVKQWYVTNEENCTIALAITPGSKTYSGSYCAGATIMAYATTYPPVLIVNYRNNVGIEDYYTYTTLGAGEAGTAYIADNSGQLKVVKQLVSFASTVNPFSMSLVYNSDYFAKTSTDTYQPPKELGLSMRIGNGWTLDVIQKVEEVVIDTTTYLKYTDGDGTEHYFLQLPEAAAGDPYYDEDGLGLQITVSGSNYVMTDKQDNTYTFTGGYLTSTTDSNGNKYLINYSGGKLSSIVQKNNGGSSIVVATFAYSGEYLSSVTDYAGNVYTLAGSTVNLTGIYHGDTLIAEYGYGGSRITSMTDSERSYSLNYAYGTDGKVSSIVEKTMDGEWGCKIGASYDGDDTTIYRDAGNDRTLGTADDLITHYLFDYAGRTVNAYTTDYYGKIIGASNAVYTGTGSTDKQNNRLLRTASIGTAAQQLMSNTGFESGTGYNTMGATTAKARTGLYSLYGVVSSGGMTRFATMTTGVLTAGKTYTLSAYVNTYAMQSANISLTVRDNQGSTWVSDTLHEITAADEWVRIHVTFTAAYSTAHSIMIMNPPSGSGTFYVDDLQLEEGEAPSNRNMLENGNMEQTSYGWTLGNTASFSAGTGLNNSASIAITSAPLNTSANASQTVQLNLPYSQTYVLSGWARGNAVPDNLDTAADAAQDTRKVFGLRAKLTYANGDVEYHYVPFNADLSDWQFTSMAIVPKATDKGNVVSITVSCAYEGNGNTAYFDNISLVQEVAQTMRYDDDGNLVATSTPGIDSGTKVYDDNGNVTKVTTGTGQTYLFDYINHNRLGRWTNGAISEYLYYDSFGNLLRTETTDSDYEHLYLTSSATYTADGNRLASATSVNGITVSQTYGSAISIMLGAPTQTTDANNVSTIVTFDNFGRTTQTTVANRATLLYNYTEGMLSSIVRSADNVNQTYSFVYDSFGNVTSMKVGSRTLASYQYGPNNGLLLSQTYGNGDIVSFTYDNLGRVKTTTYDDGRVLLYTYNGEGRLYSVTETLGEDVVTYVYNYDTIGRLISSEKKAGTTSLLRTHQSYDAYNRLIGQSWKLGDSTYSESYTYNDVDNSLDSFTAGNGQTLELAYDLLRRLSLVDTGQYEKYYTYREISEVDQTTQITGLHYTGLPTAVNFGYTYNNLGYIATYTAPDGEVITYTYDNLGQLLQAVGDVTYTYTYDSAGNILTANGHTYTYGDADWKDLLTAFDNQAITYDAIGNPLSYYNGTRWTFTWENGRSLATATNGVVNISYDYDMNGLRTSKTVGNTVHDYYYASGKLLREVITTTAEDESVTTSTLDFFYDASGQPYVLKYNGVEYYYITNLQGDVVSLVNPTSGVPVATYEYDPFGKVISATGDLATINPLRYRGYYYDTETGFYYLQSRYYDPVTCRFLNADVYVSTGQGILGYNMFAYCRNNPVRRIDRSGDVEADCVDEDGRPLSSEDIENLAAGGGVSPNTNTSGGGNNGGTVIYRYGGTSAKNLTPRERDCSSGLSFSTIPRKGAAMTTIEAINASGGLNAVQDGETHVSVFPSGASVQAWYEAGTESIWTQLLQALVSLFRGG